MKKILFFSMFMIAFLQINEKAYAQCTSCTYTATTSGASFNLNGNETLCITANVSNLNINMNGTGNIICVATGVTWIQDFLTLQGGVTVDVYGTLDNSQQSWSSVSVNGSTACTINVKTSGTMKTIAGGFGNNLTINNNGTLNFTANGVIGNAGTFILNNTATGTVNALTTTSFQVGNGVIFDNYGMVHLANVENAEGYLNNFAGGTLIVDREMNNHGAFINNGDFQLPCTTLPGAAGATTCSFRVGDKGVGKEFITNTCIKVMNGNVTFDGPGTVNAGFEIGTGYNLTINKTVTGTNGSFLVKGGTSTINVSGSYVGTNMLFYDVNTAGNGFDSNFGNNPSNFTISSSAGCGTVACTAPTLTGVSATLATCTGSTANSDASVTVSGITGMAKYAYGTNGTTGLFNSTATASTSTSITKSGLPNPSVATTYTFRIYAADSTCYNDTTVTLNPKTCVTPCTPPTITGVSADTAICANGGASSNAALHVMGISGMQKYVYGTNGAATLYYTNATTSTSATLDITGLAAPSVPTTYTFRIYGVDSTCYNDTTVILNPTTCAPCGDTFRICTSTGQTLTATVQAGVTNVQWKKDGNNLVGETNDVLTISAIGVYTYTANDANGCSGNLCCPIVVEDSVCCIVPTVVSTATDTATCTNGVVNSDAKIAVRGIVGMTKYVYGTNGTADLYYANATSSTADSIKLIALANPSVPTTYTFRIYGIDSTCYNDTTVILNPSVCAVPPVIPLPADNCSAPLQYLTTPCYVNGDPLAVGSTSASDHVLVNFPLTASGSLGSGGTELHRFANASQVGSTWGVASQASSGKIFSAAMLKRHVGLGPNGLGAIYESNIFTGDSISTPMTTAKFVDLVTDLGLDVGETQIAGMDLSNGAASNIARGLPADKAVNCTDGAVFSKIAKIGLGDLDIDESEENLFVVNLHLKKIHKINIAAKTLVASYDIPATDGASGTTMRPFGLEIAAGKLYAGVVYSKENPATLAAQDITTMTTSVYQLDLTTGIWATTPVISFPLDYTKGDVLGSLPTIDKWNVWQDNFAEWQRHNDLSIHPQPILSDMVMDNSGALHLAFMDRAGNQTGYQNNSPDNAVYPGTTDGYTGGDLLRTANVSGTLVLESNGSAGTFTGSGVGNSQGPGSGEFYSNDDKSTSHYETSWGGVAMIRSSGQLVLSIMDPFDYTAGGLKVFSTTNGTQVRAYQLYRSSGSSDPTFGKANGIGGMDLICVSNISCIPPSVTSVAIDTATCTNGVANSDAAVHVAGITGMAKYAYSTSGTAGLFALTATASTTSSIDIIGLANPSVPTTYTFRIWGVDTTCYNDTTVILTPSVCPQCAITGTFTQDACNDNGTTGTTTDDYFTLTVSAVSATNGGASGKYEVVLNGTTVLNAGGTAYGTSTTVGGAGVFAADGTTTYTLTVRDLDTPSCVSTTFMTTATQNCSVVICPTPVCIPILVEKIKNN